MGWGLRSREEFLKAEKFTKELGVHLQPLVGSRG